VNLEITVQKSLGQVNHAYTHFKVNIEAFLCNHPRGKVILNGPVDFRWVKFEELNDYPFPAATHKIIKLFTQDK
jgi:A/G-specific adenine glycosylase